MIVYTASRESVKGHFKWELLKRPKLAQVDRVLCKLFTVMRSKGKPMAGPMIIEKVKSFYD